MIFDQLPIKNLESEHEIRLWRAVLNRAAMDLIYKGRNQKTLARQKETKDWIGSSDFKTVCDLAEMLPEDVEYILQSYQKDPKWVSNYR